MTFVIGCGSAGAVTIATALGSAKAATGPEPVPPDIIAGGPATRLPVRELQAATAIAATAAAPDRTVIASFREPTNPPNFARRGGYLVNGVSGVHRTKPAALAFM